MSELLKMRQKERQEAMSALIKQGAFVNSTWVLKDQHCIINNEKIIGQVVTITSIAFSGISNEITVRISYGDAGKQKYRSDIFLRNFKKAQDTDDTFNDDTVAQTFGDIHPPAYCSVCLTGFSLEEGRRLIDSHEKCPICVSNASKMRLIGIAGPARAGKDALAMHMLGNLMNWVPSSFADPIKAMLTAIDIDCSDDAKAVIDDSYGVTPRHMMQTLGTEWGRNLIDGDIWVKAFARLNAGKCVVVSDVRFENEADLVREHGVLIHLVGRGGIEGNHVSENAIAFKPGDIVIDNSRDLAWLHGQVDGNAVLGEFISEVSE